MTGLVTKKTRKSRPSPLRLEQGSGTGQGKEAFEFSPFFYSVHVLMFELMMEKNEKTF
jgi:hypothetical protein